MSWKLIENEYIIRNKWITVRRDHVLLKSGIEIDDFYIIERPQIVHVIAITPEGKYIFERQYRYAQNRWCLELCAGLVEDGENPLQSAQRELLEETGYANGTWELISSHAVDPSNMTEISYAFLAKNVTKVTDQNLEPTEEIEVLLLSEEEIINALLSGQIISSLMAAPLWQLFYTKNIIS